MEKRHTFKYEEYLQEVREIHEIACPVEDAENRHIEAFRWVNDPMSEENFFPTRVLDELKRKKIRIFPRGHRLNCIYHSLSLFISEEDAKKKFNSFSKNIRKSIGYTHLAQSKIIENDGECTDTDDMGHFSFFEYKDVNLKDKFKIISTL